MFDIASWKLLLLAAIALIVVGPKDLPVMLRTLGRYLGMIRRQAAEFRAQFDEAIRESELSEVKKEFENLGKETEATLRDAEKSFNAEVSGIQSEVQQTYADIAKPLERIEGVAEAPAVATAEAASTSPAPDEAKPAEINGVAGDFPEAPLPPAVAWAPQPAAKTPERVEA